MTEKKTSLIEESADMIEIFRQLPEKEQAIALAYVMGRSAQPLNTVIRLSGKSIKGPAA